MCGIVGYVGTQAAAPILLEGLRRLEYRGYDSAGVAGRNGSRLQVVKSAGRLDNLERALQEQPLPGCIGIAHTRWATHGAPTDLNAHPHTDCTGRIGVVHNGIIENYLELRAWLIERGHRFSSETDSEVLAHLLEELRSPADEDGGAAGNAQYASANRASHAPRYESHLAPGSEESHLSAQTASSNSSAHTGTHTPTLLPALRRALARIEGSYAVVVLSQDDPDTLLAARRDSPLIIGLGQEETFVASDIPALVGRTRQVLVLEDGDVAVIRCTGVELQKLDGTTVRRPVLQVDWDPGQAEKGGYDHFMLKEIHEQPQALRAALAGRLHEGEDGMLAPKLEQVLRPESARIFRRVTIVACGTAFHAGLLGKQWLERWTDLPAEADLASEFRYREPRVDDNTLCIAVSQSGETADTLAALREAARRGASTLAITNVVGSSIAREAAAVLYTQAGPEIAVASTKAYTTQLACLALLAVYLGLERGTLSAARADEVLRDLLRLSDLLAAYMQVVEPLIREVGVQWQRVTDAFFIGRGHDYAVAMEGQLKLKEISYIHAEALAAGELKHGTLALITEGMPVVALATQPHLLEKSISNVKEVKARGAEVLLLAREQERGRQLEEVADTVVYLPTVDAALMPLLAALPLQLLAYYAAVARGCDVDKPRNLAKSVTVE
jgi:glucosamine--fructose-6-phosphate aminotransferase (isomerizing)